MSELNIFNSNNDYQVNDKLYIHTKIDTAVESKIQSVAEAKIQSVAEAKKQASKAKKLASEARKLASEARKLAILEAEAQTRYEIEDFFRRLENWELKP